MSGGFYESIKNATIIYIGDLFGIFAPPTQKENRIAVVRNDFGCILVDGFQLRLALQNNRCRDFPAADGGDQLVEVGYLSDVGELVQNQVQKAK